MVIVRLMGGLGNQLFQYAVGRSLAHRRGGRLFLDKSFFSYNHGENVTIRKYALGHYNIEATVLPDAIARLVAPDRSSRVPRFFDRLASKNFTVRPETSMDFDSGVYEAPANSILDGYWQTEKYFYEIKSLLYSELVPRKSLSAECQAAAWRFGSNNVASIHVRRGDYVTNPSAASYHGTCSIGWYKAAISTLKEITSVDQFVIFSDDLDWAKENFQFLPNACFSDDLNTRGDWEDLYLMSCCKHNIIANSSFSWWGAWLNRHDRKVVIAPRKWFVEENPSHDRIPSSWIVV